MKLVFLLLVYFAGFATAIYFLAPAPQATASSAGQNASVVSSFDTRQFAESLNAGMHKAIAFGKDAAIRMGKYLKERYDERQSRPMGAG